MNEKGKTFTGLPDLKIPDPTKMPSHPSCIIMAASDGVEIPPAAKFTTGRQPSAAVSFNNSYGAPSSFAYLKKQKFSCGPKFVYSNPLITFYRSFITRLSFVFYMNYLSVRLLKIRER